ncbi:hypothetical protein PITC_030320 [Penicillium italicum]|uniref:Uncharacterized protein n=1 Tax=Penicillium italicum TaxID=40296 RepID=A0A0A2LGI2_PENIT|nr:hypothetical protein PITC_030320 [Penicillium italicum]
MRLQILLHPQLRTTLSECAQRNLQRSISVRFKSHIPRPSQKHLSPLPKSKETLPAARSPVTRTLTPPKTTTRAGSVNPPVVYYGGTGRAIFLGTLRITTVLLFGAACLIVAPACSVADDSPWYTTPAVIAAGALPMLFVSYTAAPYVNFIHLALPAFARKSWEAAVQYAKDLPPTAVLYLTSMRFNTIPRQTTARLGDLVPIKDTLRPVTFQNLNPSPQRWWQGRAPTQFYTGTHSKPGRQTSAFFPEIWNGIYQQIQKAKSRPH